MFHVEHQNSLAVRHLSAEGHRKSMIFILFQRLLAQNANVSRETLPHVVSSLLIGGWN